MDLFGLFKGLTQNIDALKKKKTELLWSVIDSLIFLDQKVVC